MSRKVEMPRRGLLRDSPGTASVEFALVVSVFFLFVFGIIDFNKAFWEMNSAAKAAQFGVRFAVVNDPVSDAVIFDGTAAGVPNGEPVPIATFNGGAPVVCSRPAGSTVCDAGTADDDAFMAIVAKMQQINAGIQPENVIVSYEHIGLGFSGSPFGSSIDPMVTVRVTGLTLTLITPGLAQLAASITIRDFASTQLAEDLES